MNCGVSKPLQSLQQVPLVVAWCFIRILYFHSHVSSPVIIPFIILLFIMLYQYYINLSPYILSPFSFAIVLRYSNHESIFNLSVSHLLTHLLLFIPGGSGFFNNLKIPRRFSSPAPRSPSNTRTRSRRVAAPSLAPAARRRIAADGTDGATFVVC